VNGRRLHINDRPDVFIQRSAPYATTQRVESVGTCSRRYRVTIQLGHGPVAWRRISSSSSSKLTPAGTAHSRPRQLTAYAASREISEMKYAGSWIRPFGPAHFSGALRPDHKNCVARTVLNSARTWANQLSMLNRFVFDLCFSWATQT